MKKILIDTQEKLPYSFDSSKFITERVKLETGDYILEEYPSGPVIERKSLSDWIVSIKLDRFYRELDRLTKFDMPLIVVEASIPDIISRKYESPLPPSEVICAGINIIKDYKIPIIYSGDRQHAIYFVSEVFNNYEKKKEIKVKKKRVFNQKEEDIL